MLTKDIKTIVDFIKNCSSSTLPIYKQIVWNSKNNCHKKVFISLKTNKNQRYEYINEAIERGAIAIISDQLINKSKLVKDVPFFIKKELSKTYNNFLDHIYDYPLKNKKIVGITGTDGKSSMVNLIAQAYTRLGIKVGVISSAGNGIYPILIKSSYTTPRPDILFGQFYNMNLKKAKIIIIECSSQALDQGRIDNIKFNTSIITNIFSDHLDYHKSEKRYIKSKFKLINMTSDHILINKDCKKSIKEIFRMQTKAKIHLYGVLDNSLTDQLSERKFSKFTINPVDNSPTKQVIISKNKKISIKSSLHGHVNLYNILVVFILLNNDKKIISKIINVIHKLTTIKGRNQIINSSSYGSFIIDYAHTPSSLLNLLRYSRKTIDSNKKIITIFGCGGDRDVWKRKEMGAIASKYSDIIIITDDNPRSEDSSIIINHILMGVKKTKNVFIIPSREKAISKAISLANLNSLTIIAGKGNENDIIYKNKIIKHNDIKILRALII